MFEETPRSPLLPETKDARKHVRVRVVVVVVVVLVVVVGVATKSVP